MDLHPLGLSPGHIASPRATARVPTPLHTTPALTMIHGESRSLRHHSKGGGGVERGGDPCGRPGGGRASAWRCLLNHNPNGQGESPKGWRSIKQIATIFNET